jgi:ABC-type Na+ efflux pump permease subunit
LKNTLADTDSKQGSTDDLKNTSAVALDVNGDNSIATITLAPVAHKVDERTVRDYLLGSIVLEFAVIMLIVTNAAASTVTREKEDGTLDLLLTTPITSRYYIWGKLRGLVWFVLPLVAVPVASVTVFVLYDLFRFAGTSSAERWIAFPESIILMPMTMIIVAAFAGILGMQMSLRCRTTVMAVMASVGIVVGTCGVLALLGYKFLDMRDSGAPSLVIASFSPFTVMSMMVNPYDFASAAFSNADDAISNRVAIFIGSLIAVAAYTGVVWYMYTSMVKNFDMTIRRQQR